MNEVHHDGHRDVPLLGQLLEPIELRQVAVHDGDPAFLTGRIAVRRLVKHRRDDGLGRVFEAGPDAFVFGPGASR